MSSDKKQLAQFTQIGEIAAQTARDNLLVAFRSQGISEQVLAVAADDLLFATKQKVQYDAKSKQFNYSKHMADNTTRYNTLKLMLDFFDAMPSKKIDINDKRQTRDLANQLFKRLEQAGQLGADDVGNAAIDVEHTEVALMEEMNDRFEQKRKTRYVSLMPDMADDE
jgi:hypothetical protein